MSLKKHKTCQMLINFKKKTYTLNRMLDRWPEEKTQNKCIV